MFPRVYPKRADAVEDFTNHISDQVDKCFPMMQVLSGHEHLRKARHPSILPALQSRDLYATVGNAPV